MPRDPGNDGHKAARGRAAEPAVAVSGRRVPGMGSYLRTPRCRVSGAGGGGQPGAPGL